MNKLLQSVTSAVHTITNTNENTVKASPDHIDLNLRIDIDTWRYFENLDDDSRTIMARILRDYVEKQR